MRANEFEGVKGLEFFPLLLRNESMIDTHSHVFSGVDDGPAIMVKPVVLAKVLVQEGIQAAIATTYFNDLFPQRSTAEIKERVKELQQVLDQKGILLRLFAGHMAGGLMGKQGNTSRTCAGMLLRKGYIHCFASAHGLSSRLGSVAKGLQRASELLGYSALNRLIETFPVAIDNDGSFILNFQITINSLGQ